MGKQILLIEDDHLVKESVMDLLVIGGYEVDTADNGEEGFSMIMDKHPDLVISDVMMPKMDGFELIMKMNEESVKVPFLFLTAKSRQDDMKKGLQLGADDYLIKPFSNSELLQKVEDLLQE